MPLHIGQKKILLLSYLIVIETWTNLPTAKNCLLTLAKFDAKFKHITVYTSTAKLTQSGGDLEMHKRKLISTAEAAFCVRKRQ